MICVGIYTAKPNHLASTLSSDGEILMEPFKFTNDANGDDSLITVLESTAHYGDNLIRYLVASYFKVCVQPYQDIYNTKE